MIEASTFRGEPVHHVADLFYSEDEDEKETNARANYLARDFGAGKKIDRG
jgi:hypothetical protein